MFRNSVQDVYNLHRDNCHLIVEKHDKGQQSPSQELQGGSKSHDF